MGHMNALLPIWSSTIVKKGILANGNPWCLEYKSAHLYIVQNLAFPIPEPNNFKNDTLHWKAILWNGIG